MSIPSCGGNANSGYAKTSFRELGVRFGFEYPLSYGKPEVDRTGLPHLVTVGILPLAQNTEWYPLDPIITITLLNSKYYGTDVSSSLEGRLTEYKAGFPYLDFRLLARSPVTIDGAYGEEIVFSHTWTPNMYEGQKGESHPLNGRNVYFYSDGVIWEFSLASSFGTAEKANADFEHILQTFKILD
jgi:hypothetical protein